MKRVADLVAWLERFAPGRLAESWDNVGLLLGDPQAGVSRVMTCLTVTRTTAEEAVSQKADLILSHHPILFRAAKQIRADQPATSVVWTLARAGIAVASPHTAFDSTTGGINDGLCRRLGLSSVVPLRSFAPASSYKVVVFTPEADREAVLAAAFEAGAGVIGEYRECSFSIPGQGSFFGSENSDPKNGAKGRRETVAELRVEVLCPESRLGSVLAAVRSAHSYEEPAIDVYPLKTQVNESGFGSGRIGSLASPQPLEEFAAFVSKALGNVSIQLVGKPDRRVSRVAVSCGAGDDFLGDAARAGADVLVTGEARFHQALEAETLGIGLILAGHHGTERPGVEDLAERVAAEFSELTVWASREEKDPLRTL